MPTPPRFGPTGRGILLMLTAIFFFTLLDAFAKDLVSRYPVAQVVWTRIGVQLVLVALILLGAPARAGADCMAGPACRTRGDAAWRGGVLLCLAHAHRAGRGGRRSPI